MDQDYLRDVQYKDGRNLTARADLHAKYRTAPVPWFEWMSQQVDWPERGDVLEVGCGTGWLWAEVPAPLRLTLTDLSEGMVAEAAARVAQCANITLVATQSADVQALPFDDGSFDLVLANHMLYHVPDIGQAVRELRRVLRPSGLLVTATNGLAHMQQVGKVLGGPGLSEFSRRFGKENGAAILGETFGAVEWREFPDELHCTDADDVVAYIVSMAPGLFTDDDHAALRDEVAARMVDGIFRITKETGLFLAR